MNIAIDALGRRASPRAGSHLLLLRERLHPRRLLLLLHLLLLGRHIHDGGLHVALLLAAVR